MNILFTCGGTAGHVNPAVALAHIFQERHPGCRVLFVGASPISTAPLPLLISPTTWAP